MKVTAYLHAQGNLPPEEETLCTHASGFQNLFGYAAEDKRSWHSSRQQLATAVSYFQSVKSRVGCATTNNATTNEYYNEQILSIKLGRYKEQCYNECGGILFIMESPIIVFTRERFLILMCVIPVVCFTIVWQYMCAWHLLSNTTIFIGYI